MNVKCENKKLEIPEGSSVKKIVEELNLREPHQALAANINGQICDLETPLSDGDDVKLLDFEKEEGKEIFWHTSAHVLAQAVLRLWPEAKPTIGPPIENGFYYDFDNLEISEDDFPKIEKEIKKILSENLVPERHLFKGRKEGFGKNRINCKIVGYKYTPCIETIDDTCHT